MTHVQITAAQARRFLIRRQSFRVYGSDFEGRSGVEAALRHLEAVQIDPINAFERNHHQVLYNRVWGYRPELLDAVLYKDGGAFEYYCNALCVLPVQDYPYFRFRMEREAEGLRGYLNSEMLVAMDDVERHITEQGKTSSRELDSGRKISGWWDAEPRTKIEKQALDYLHLAGRVLITSREGNQRSYDLPERLIPAGLLNRKVTEPEWRRFMMSKFLRAFGLSQTSLQRFGWFDAAKAEKRVLLKDLIAEGFVTEVEVEGVDRPYYCPAELLPELLKDEPLPETDAAVFLAPLDNLLWDRDRVSDLWGFDYRWEVYTPVAQRQYGYYVVPMLWGENLAGRIELRANRPGSELRVENIWYEDGAPKGIKGAALKAAVDEAKYLGLHSVTGVLGNRVGTKRRSSKDLAPT